MKKLENCRNYKVNGKQFAYILDAIHSDTREFSTDKERIEYFFECFNKEYNDEYYKRIYPNETDRIANWLQGLPSCIGIDYENSTIIEIGKSWGYCKTEKKENEFIENWFFQIALKLRQLRDMI